MFGKQFLLYATVQTHTVFQIPIHSKDAFTSISGTQLVPTIHLLCHCNANAQVDEMGIQFQPTALQDKGKHLNHCPTALCLHHVTYQNNQTSTNDEHK